MDFTRQPILETVITPKEGCKLVVRSSKSGGQEEYFVDALEVVSFGNAIFFRSIERPKAFIVPASDYEVVEVREARMALKNVGIEKPIKIGGGKETAVRMPKEPAPVPEVSEEPISDRDQEPQRMDKKRDKRRHSKRRRGGREEGTEEEGEVKEETPSEAATPQKKEEKRVPTPLLPPPPTLISETIARYKDNALFKSAFYVKEPDGALVSTPEEATNGSHPDDAAEVMELQNISLQTPDFGYFEFMEEDQKASVPEQEQDKENSENKE